MPWPADATAEAAARRLRQQPGTHAATARGNIKFVPGAPSDEDAAYARGWTALTKLQKRAAVLLLAGLNDSSTAAHLLEAYRKAVASRSFNMRTGEPGVKAGDADLVVAIDELYAELATHDGEQYLVGRQESLDTGLPEGKMCAFARNLSATLDTLRPMRKRRNVAPAIYGDPTFATSDAGYQATLCKLEISERERLAGMADAHWQAADKRFVKGHGASPDSNTPGQVASSAELAGVLERADATGPVVVAVVGWSQEMMGIVPRVVGVAGTTLGDCADVNAQGGKHRASACIAQHWLRYVFPERIRPAWMNACTKACKTPCETAGHDANRRAAYPDKAKARVALADELRRQGLGRQLCFVDASALPLTPHDWAEAASISQTCDVVVIVSVSCPGDAPEGVPCLPAPVRKRARPVAAGAPGLSDDLFGVLKEAVEGDASVGSWLTRGQVEAEKVQMIQELVAEMERQPQWLLTPRHHQILNTARRVVAEGGAYESNSEDEDDADDRLSEPEFLVPGGLKLPRYYVSGPLAGHHENCDSTRCMCSDGTGIGANGAKSMRLG